MKSIFTLIFLALFNFANAQTTPTYGIREKNTGIKAFTNAKIFVSPELTIEKGTLIVENGILTEVGASVTIPKSATIFDLAGMTVYAGFTDVYTSYGLPQTEKQKPDFNSSPKYEGTRTGGNSWNDAIHSEKNWCDNFKPKTEDAKALKQLGFTAVQSAKMDGIFRGRSCVVFLDDGLPNELFLNPKSSHFLAFNKGTSKQEFPSSVMGSIALLRQTFYDFDWYSKAKNAYKFNPNQKTVEFNSSLENFSKNEKMIFEAETELSILRADKIAKEFGLNFVIVGNGYEYAKINEIKAANLTLILPLNFPEAPLVKTIEDELDATLANLRHWETAPYNLSILEKENVKFALTTYKLKKKEDFLKNLRLAIKKGLTEKTALKSLTTIPAEICGLSDKIGTLEKGKFANFIVASGNIFEEKTKVYSVFSRGNECKINPMPKTDFRANYRLEFEKNIFELALKGETDAVKGEIKLGKGKKLEPLTVEEDKISFSVKIDTLDLKGTLRFSGRKENAKIFGYGTFADGTRFLWNAEKVSDFAAEPDTTKKDEKKDERLAKITFPNKAFGFETLPQTENVLIKDATVWTSEKEGILENTDVLVQNGKFAKIGKNLQAPQGIKIIDAKGKHVTAGMIDEHSHIAIYGGVNEGSDAISSEVRIGDVVNPDDINIYRQLSGGVTVSQLLHGSANPIGGQAQVIKLRFGSGAEEMKFREAPPTIKFALGENVKQSNWGDLNTIRYPQTRMGVETIMKDEFQTAREYEAKWKSFGSAKDKEKIVPPRKDLELEAILEILNKERFVHCHSYVQTEILMLMRLAEEFGFKIQTFTHILEGYKVASEMKKHGTTASSFADWWAYKFEVYDAIPYNPALLSEKGVVTSINSDDAEMGRRLNQEAGKSVLYGGMKQEEAIKLATINPAIQLKIDDKVGSVKVGKDADFVIWNGNPLSVYTKVLQTWIEGKKYFDVERDLELRKEIKREKSALIQKIIEKGGGSPGASFKNDEEEYDCEDVFDFWKVERE
ncbi:amidohydrolase family protein [bacterium]|nr:amidohydrolase family protein [bacterium]